MAYLYGLLNMKDLYTRRVTEQGVEEVATAIQRSVDEHNRQMAALIALFARRTEQFKTRFRTPVAAQLQPLDNSGRALPIKPAGQYDVAFPLQQAGLAWGADDVTEAYMTIEEAAEATATLIDADMRWMRNHLLAALFLDGSWAFTDDLHGALTVYGPASGDATTYNILTGADQEATDDHLVGTAALVQADFAAAYADLKEHPENGGEVIAFISTADQATVEAFAGFYEVLDPDIRPAMTAAVLQGNLGVNVPGEVIGKVENVWVVVWRSMPANYILFLTTEGERPLALREDTIPELRGFRQSGDRSNYPWRERQYRRRAGFGAWNRVGVYVLRTGNGTYAAPTGYGSPMP